MVMKTLLIITGHVVKFFKKFITEQIRETLEMIQWMILYSDIWYQLCVLCVAELKDGGLLQYSVILLSCGFIYGCQKFAGQLYICRKVGIYCYVNVIYVCYMFFTILFCYTVRRPCQKLEQVLLQALKRIIYQKNDGFMPNLRGVSILGLMITIFLTDRLHDNTFEKLMECIKKDAVICLLKVNITDV